MIESVNDSGIKISGLITQTAIEPISLSIGSGELNIYQGFWVPNISVTSVTDSLNTYQENINIFPNPISNSANIYYYLSTKSLVSIKLYDILGELVAGIYYGIQEPGSKLYVWDVTDVRNGTYLIGVEAKSMITNGSYSSRPNKYYKKVIILK
jgi:hypothetical protein